MARLENKNPHGRYFLTAAFASILLILGMSASEVFAMGQAPSTCPNRYDATITEMILNNGTHTFDPIQNPDMVFRAEIHAGYSISMTLRTTNQVQMAIRKTEPLGIETTFSGMAMGIAYMMWALTKTRL